MKTTIISTKEMRNDLEGFLRKLKNGQTIQVMYRSKPLVTVIAKHESDAYLAENAGSPEAARHSVRFVKNIPKRTARFDPDKSFKELYDETQTL